MGYADFETAITAFLEDVVVTSKTGSSSTKLRARALMVGQRCVNLYWEQPWKLREKQDDIEFDADGVAEIPGAFASWQKSFGHIVFPTWRLSINPSRHDTNRVMALRSIYPTRTGRVEAVVMHGNPRALYRWPTKPPGNTTEDAVAFYHRIPPQLTDDDETDELALIPVEDQEVILDGMLAGWDVKSGDGREAVHDVAFRKRIRELYRSRNLDEQPTKLGKPFRAPGSGQGPIVGDRWNT